MVKCVLYLYFHVSFLKKSASEKTARIARFFDKSPDLTDFYPSVFCQRNSNIHNVQKSLFVAQYTYNITKGDIL